MSSEMLGSARPEKDVKLTGEFDWRFIFSDGYLPCMCSFLWSVRRRIIFDTYIKVAILKIGATEKFDWLDSRNTTAIVFHYRGIVSMRYLLADSLSEHSNNHIICAILRCLVADATLLKINRRRLYLRWIYLFPFRTEQ